MQCVAKSKGWWLESISINKSWIRSEDIRWCSRRDSIRLQKPYGSIYDSMYSCGISCFQSELLHIVRKLVYIIRPRNFILLDFTRNIWTSILFYLKPPDSTTNPKLSNWALKYEKFDFLNSQFRSPFCITNFVQFPIKRSNWKFQIGFN